MVALITGATGGLGSECAKLLAAVEGLKVVAVSRSADRLNELKKEIRSSLDLDIDILTSDFEVTGFEVEIADHIKSKYGELNYLLNNAGMLINKSFGDMTAEEAGIQLRVNFLAPLALTRALIPLLKKAAHSHVVNIGSMGGFQGSEKFPGLSAYSASKGALAILTECLAREYAESGIDFNCLALGSADTGMLRKAFPDYQSPVSAAEMGGFIVDFIRNGNRYFNGKVIPVAGLSR